MTAWCNLLEKHLEKESKKRRDQINRIPTPLHVYIVPLSLLALPFLLSFSTYSLHFTIISFLSLSFVLGTAKNQIQKGLVGLISRILQLNKSYRLVISAV
ncbi:hypothetical protein BCR41DRAFT_17805 [Lobosporangium transversale]|uniref:Uncharacterized protein n=1 Tax=Lobosporangium transversale TaxID=64571 RepID=A0A1Y2GTU4_9FUNG|nr:hypothetical protein BCR41DRAFT_17805 [Lobosporangium transversale]ORZ22906.1 hypothetical protein BCR41DRAFT_17805 [Lobosporangium transversale]|eukprot:XP_021883460.1 hypothetical protein BCR41DRAFT_17805 [Lobosporangium transversale]